MQLYSALWGKCFWVCMFFRTWEDVWRN